MHEVSIHLNHTDELLSVAIDSDDRSRVLQFLMLLEDSNRVLEYKVGGVGYQVLRHMLTGCPGHWPKCVEHFSFERQNHGKGCTTESD